MEFIKKPVKINAIAFHGHDWKEVLEWIRDGGGKAYERDLGNVIVIETLEGDMKARRGDWIIQGVNGEFYPCKPDIFEKTYDKVHPDGPRLGQEIQVGPVTFMPYHRLNELIHHAQTLYRLLDQCRRRHEEGKRTVTDSVSEQGKGKDAAGG